MKTPRHITALVLTAAAVLQSCEYDFELDGLKEEPIIMVEGEIRESGLFEYTIRALNPVNSGQESCLTECMATFSINGELIKRVSFPYTYTTLSSSEQLDELEAGDMVSMTVSASGMAPVSGRTSLPAPFPEIKVTHSRIDEENMNVKITFTDDPDTDNYYGIHLVNRSSIQTPGTTSINTSKSLTLSGPAVNSEGTSSYGELRVRYNDDGATVHIFSDHGFNGKEKTIDVNVDCESSRKYSSYTKLVEYNIYLYTLSAEKYRYCVAQFDSSPYNNTLGFMGLSPVTFTYTSIDGGAGYLGCATIRESGWITAPYTDGTQAGEEE